MKAKAQMERACMRKVGCRRISVFAGRHAAAMGRVKVREDHEGRITIPYREHKRDSAIC